MRCIAFAYNASNALALVASTLASSATRALFEAMTTSNIFCVPHVLVKYVWSVAKRVTIMHGTVTLPLTGITFSLYLAIYYCPCDVFKIWFIAAGEEKKILVY